MLGPLIGAVGSVVGGLIGSQPSRQRSRSRSTSTGGSTSRSTNRAHLGELVRQAEKHGFNPLTLLRAGGLSAYSTTKTTGTSWGKSFTKGKGSATSPAPLGAGIAQAAQTIGGAIAEGPSAQSGAARDAWQAGNGAAAEMDLVNRQLADVRPGTIGGQPQHRSSQVYSKDKPALASTDYDGRPMVPVKQDSEVNNDMPVDTGMLVDPATPNPSGRYPGEIFENAQAAYVAYRDTRYNVENSDWYKEALRDGKSLLERYRRSPITSVEGVPAVKTNVWDPVAIKLFVPPVVKWQDDAPMAINHYKKPEFVDGGPKW